MVWHRSLTWNGPARSGPQLALLALWIVLSGAAATAGAGAGAGADRPNVLLIGVDDLNDWIGVLGGHPQSTTPHMDQLAKRGLLFTNAHCAAPVCNPSRTALMTGIRPSTSGVYRNDQPFRTVLPDAVTLPQYFMTHGYVALGAGKIFHGPSADPASWHDYYPSKARTRPSDPMPLARPLNGFTTDALLDWGALDVEDAEMGDARVVDWVIGRLQQKHDRPLFLACGIFRPHLPWYVPKKYFEAHPLANIRLPAVRADDLDDVPPPAVELAGARRDHLNITTQGQWHRAVQGYLAAVTFADAQVGRVLDALDRSAYAHNTIVVLWSDQGWHLGEKGHWRKGTLWEEATRTPLAIIAPGVTQAGTRCNRPVNLLDIYPTLIDLCRLPPRQVLEGVSLRPLLVDPNAEWDRPSLTTHRWKNHAVRTDRFRYIRYADGSQELYDHESDPTEWHNLADDPRYDDVVQRLARWLPEDDAPDVPPAGGRGRQPWWRLGRGPVFLLTAALVVAVVTFLLRYVRRSPAAP